MTDDIKRTPMPIFKNSTHPHGLNLGSVTKGLKRDEPDWIRFRAHIKYNKWDVWEFVYAPDIDTAREFLKARMVVKGRGMIPVASIVRSDVLREDPLHPDMPLREQIIQDRALPDGMDAFLPDMTDEEKAQANRARVDNDQRLCDYLLDKLKKRQDEKARVDAARKKRLAQLADDPGGNPERAVAELERGLVPYTPPPTSKGEDGKLRNPHKSQSDI